VMPRMVEKGWTLPWQAASRLWCQSMRPLGFSLNALTVCFLFDVLVMVTW